MGRLGTSSELQRRNHLKRDHTPTKTVVSTLVLSLAAIYFLVPLYWLIVSSTKSTNQLFNTPILLPAFSPGVKANFDWLTSYGDGVFWRWALNSVILAAKPRSWGRYSPQPPDTH